VVALVETAGGAVWQLSFDTGTGTDANSGSCATDFIGNEGTWNDGQWHYLELDLAARLGTGSTLALAKVHGLIVHGVDLYVDDVILSGGALERSYQIYPGASIGGTLGEQNGASTNYSIIYYHYNELGTVVATTLASGALQYAYEADAFGNYYWSAQPGCVRVWA
jgi:hypothetical protein